MANADPALPIKSSICCGDTRLLLVRLLHASPRVHEPSWRVGIHDGAVGPEQRQNADFRAWCVRGGHDMMVIDAPKQTSLNFFRVGGSDQTLRA